MGERIWDLFTFGETMARFTPVGSERLEEARALELRTGGSESNVAVGMARLGCRVSWASRLPSNDLGRMVVRRLRGFGVDVSQVVWAPGERLGLYFIEPGAAPRSASVLYDRAGSAASRLQPEMLDWDFLDSVRHVHVTGITLAIGSGPADAVRRAVSEAHSRGCSVSLDLNYRARLWSAEEAREALMPILAGSDRKGGGGLDVLITTAEDAHTVLDMKQRAGEELAREIGANCTAGTVVVTLGGTGAVVWDRRTGQVHRAEPYPVTPVDRIGAGDAFDAGFLWGYLRGNLVEGLQLGMAMAALKHSILGDEYVASLEEAQDLIRRGHGDVRR